MKRSPNIVRRNNLGDPDREGLGLKRRKTPPHEFVLEALASVSPWTRPMFGCLAVYVEEKIVLILREQPDHPSDNGVWLATTVEHHESLRREFPAMRSIAVLGKGVTGWQILPGMPGISRNWRCARVNWCCAATLASVRCREQSAPNSAAPEILTSLRSASRNPHVRASLVRGNNLRFS